MKADIKWLDDPHVFKVNEVALHSDHPFFKNKHEADINK